MDLKLLGNKLQRYREQFQATHAEVQNATGIAEDQLRAFEAGQATPTGDEILILADYYKCDYKFFVSNEKLAPFEQTEKLFRLHGSELAKEDRWAIQEFLFLCENEDFLEQMVPRIARQPFTFTPSGRYFKGHGVECAKRLRQRLGYGPTDVAADVFDDLRKIGVHVFRRQLGNSAISGLFILHPVAGQCVLVNYDEDVNRQRFTGAHEGGHAIFDSSDQVVVSFTTWAKGDLREIRANTFASSLLLPPSLLNAIPDAHLWDEKKAVDYASRLKVSTVALAVALKEGDFIDDSTFSKIRAAKVPPHAKEDPELPTSLSPKGKERKQALLRRGLSDYYVALCFDAYDQNQVTSGRLAEMLLLGGPNELQTLATLYGRSMQHVS
jgi:Zn-dependent peptidase ImmA (M78 family)/transcriptional regulator with XRE-family HTH domain